MRTQHPSGCIGQPGEHRAARVAGLWADPAGGVELALGRAWVEGQLPMCDASHALDSFPSRNGTVERTVVEERERKTLLLLKKFF